MDYKDMGSKIRALRRERHLTQEQLAEQVDISPSFLGHIERGTRIASIDTLAALCRELQVSPAYLMESGLGVPLKMPDGLTEKQHRHINELVALVSRQMRE